MAGLLQGHWFLWALLPEMSLPSSDSSEAGDGQAMWEKTKVPGSAAGAPARYEWAGKGPPMEGIAHKEGSAVRNCFSSGWRNIV